MRYPHHTNLTNSSAPNCALSTSAKAGRDLFDLATALTSGKADPQRVVKSFLRYMEHEKHQITRALFEQNFAEKMKDPAFLADISPLLSEAYKWDPKAEAPIVSSAID